MMVMVIGVLTRLEALYRSVACGHSCHFRSGYPHRDPLGLERRKLSDHLLLPKLISGEFARQESRMPHVGQRSA
jgi:hypothetical protein